MAAKEFPGYYVVGGRKLTADGAPYKRGAEDDGAAESPDQAQIRELQARIAELEASKPEDGKTEVDKSPAAPTPEATAKPAPGPGVSKVPGKP